MACINQSILWIKLSKNKQSIGHETNGSNRINEVSSLPNQFVEQDYTKQWWDDRKRKQQQQEGEHK